MSVGATVVIERPIDEVAGFAGDPTTWPAWHRHVVTADWTTEPPVRLGSRAQVGVRFLWRRIELTVEVVELTHGEQVAVRTVDGPLPIRTVVTWRPVGRRVTHMALRYDLTPVGIQRLMSPLVARVLRRTIDAELASLKRLLET